MAPVEIVVGSGPSGVAAASALLDAGRRVVMLDVGRTLENSPERLEEHGDDPARKLVFGSAYPYDDDREAGLVQRGTRALVSGGKGGLSAVWGASVLPFPEDELGDWPVSAADLRPHYAKAAALLGISGAPDDLAAKFPFHTPPAAPLRLSGQAQGLINTWVENAAVLHEKGFLFGRARHAVNSAACEYDGTCLRGCARGAIWNAAGAVETLKKRSGFEYRGGSRVLGIEERGETVRLHVAPAGASRTTVDAPRVFLACGPLATARLVCASFGAPAEGLTMLAQPYFVLPMLLDRGVTSGAKDHTLAQLYLELADASVSKHLAHLQVYGRNEVIDERLNSAALWAGPFAGLVKSRLGPRLMAIQGYLHSDEGSPVTVTASGKGEDLTLTLKAGDSSGVRAAVNRVKSKLGAHADELGFRVLPVGGKIGLPGEGNHVGGLFPMRSASSSHTTDRVGRLHGRDRVHIVDSSVLPSLPATTFTYAVMANASRIASEA